MAVTFRRRRCVEASSQLTSLAAFGIEVILSGGDLRLRKFNGVDLRSAVLREARLGGTDFRTARLEDADLADSKVDERTNFSQAIFGGRKSVLPRELRKSILSGTSFFRFSCQCLET